LYNFERKRERRWLEKKDYNFNNIVYFIEIILLGNQNNYVNCLNIDDNAAKNFTF